MPQQHIINFNKSALTYNNNIDVQNIATKTIATLINQYLNESALIIDIGCGNGNLKSQLPNHNIIGIDLAFNMCAIASTIHPTICTNATALPFANHTINNISSTLCLQWVNPLTAAIAEIARVLIPDGYAIIAILSHGTMPELEKVYNKLGIKSRLLPYLTTTDIAITCHQFGLNIIQQTTKKYIIYHQNPLSFFKQLKAIGANQTNHPPLNLQQLNQLIKLYETTFIQTQGLPVTYAVSYLVTQLKQTSTS